MFFGNLLSKYSEMLAPAETPDHEFVVAATQNDWDRCLHSLNSGAIDPFDLKAFKCTALHVAAKHNFLQLAEHLMDSRGLQVDLLDAAGESPLHHAARGGHKPLVELFLSRGADILLRSKDNQTPYDLCSNLVVRQYLLPIHLKAESDRGLSVTPLGATSDKVYTDTSIGPPPPMMPAMHHSSSEPALQHHNTARQQQQQAQAQPQIGVGFAPPPAALQPAPNSTGHTADPQQQQQWRPIMADGFASGSNDYSSGGAQQTASFNRFSAFNGPAASNAPAAVNQRYVAYGGLSTAAPQQQQQQQVYSPPQQVYSPPQQQQQQQQPGMMAYPFQQQQQQSSPGVPLYQPPPGMPGSQPNPPAALSPTSSEQMEEIPLN